jgi:tetratricopeptide (TPR) repeat protein/tRNA A-37 threonylcarbamoyl transferase component Bud32
LTVEFAESAITVPPGPPGSTVGSGATVSTIAPPAALEPDTTGLPPSAGGIRHRPSARSVLTVGKAFGTRYHIVRLLGTGGMGAVYQAWDSELNVIVALKVIRVEEFTDREIAAIREKQFKTELLLARQVTHKNVVRIHDLGEIDGIKYITMPYVEGEDLATLITKCGQLPLSRSLKLSREIAAGLEAAHEAAVVHRDLKPANVMVSSEDVALILDFGIARSSSNAEQGIAGIVGTLEYMAPEQATGKDVDQRADIYAFGLILFEMLVGRRTPSGINTALDDMKARITKGLPRLRSVDPNVPVAVDELVAKCLEPDREARFQTSAELVRALSRLDDNGEVIPEPRRLTWRLMAAAAVVVVVLLTATFFLTRSAVLPPEQHEPVSVVIADLQNLTNDPAFDRTLEPMLKRALEGAGFITAFDRNGITRTLDERPPERLDEVAARELAVKQGLGVVLSGSINRQGNGFVISMKAAQTVTGNVIAETRGRASNKDQVVGVATRLVTTVRQALGDSTSESDQMFAMASLSATSLDVVRHYAAAQEAASNGKFDQAYENAAKAVELDPKFGIGYQLLAVASRNLGRLQDADKFADEALRHLEGMTERERYSTRGLFFRVVGDYQQCVKEYGDLLARYSADIVGLNQHALCSSKLRNIRAAADEMRRVVNMLPKRVLFRVNLALYSNYAGDFQTGEKEARTIQEPHPYAMLALAFAQVGQGQLAQAAQTYQKLSAMGTLGSSLAASGLGDLAMHEGRFEDAVKIFEQGAAADLSAGNADRAAAKFAAVAHARILQQKKPAAVAAADKALANSKAVTIRFLAARVFIEADEVARAQTLIAGFAPELQAEPQAYAKILEGELALKGGDARGAIKLLIEANGLLDTWIGHYVLGRAYLEAGAFAQADSELDRCLRRRGEALSLFLDEEPTYAYFPPLYYYQGRVREALNNAGFAESYRAYLNVRGGSKEDALVPEARKRAGG